MVEEPPTQTTGHRSWHRQRLDELLRFSNGKSRPIRDPGGSYEIYGSNGIIGRVATPNTDYGSIVVGRVGSFCGSVHYSKRQCWVTDNAIAAEAYAPNNARFLYYLLQHLRLNTHRIGSGQPLLTQQILGVIHASVPPPPEQIAIAEVLGALDDKIENAERIGDLASDLAIAAGVSALEEAALEEAAGKPVYLSAQADLIKGVSYRSEDLVEGGGHLVGLKCVGRDGRFRREGLKPFSGDCRPEQLVRQGDVLVAQTDLTQKAEVIGRPVRFPKLDSGGRLVASLDLVIARPHAPLTRETLVALLSTQDFRDHAMSYCNGTTVLHMSSRALPDYRFIMPSPSIMEKVGNVMRTLFARADAARKESLVLAQLRDTLLPRLLSGELRVRDAEAAVEGAV